MEKLIKFNGIVTIMGDTTEYCLYSTTFHTKTNMFIFIPKDMVIYREFPHTDTPPPGVGGKKTRKLQHKRRHTKRRSAKRKHTKRKHKRKHTKRI